MAVVILGFVFWNGGVVVGQVIPHDPEVSVGEYLHFVTGLPFVDWHLVANESGGTIQPDTGLYQAGPNPGLDMVIDVMTAQSGIVMVNPIPRPPGVVGPATSMDVDGDGVGLSDVILMLKDVVGVEDLTSVQAEAADFDWDWAVGLDDVLNALRVVVGLAPLLYPPGPG